MPKSASLLIFGRDPRLLETREWVLKAAGHRVWTAANLSDVIDIASREKIDLLILCHTLSIEECRRAHALSYPGFPTMKSLTLTRGESGCQQELLSEVLDAMEGPAKLISKVARLVGAESTARSQTTNPSPQPG